MAKRTISKWSPPEYVKLASLYNLPTSSLINVLVEAHLFHLELS
jgi:hypothetical protein